MNGNIILYPSDWLFNAGIIGLLDILETCNNINIESLIINNAVELNINTITNILNTNNKNSSQSLLNLPIWHQKYIEESFKKNYGSIKSFVEKSIANYKNKTLNKAQLRDKLLCKWKNLKNLNDDISDYINKINAQSDTKKMINDIVNKICKYKNEYVYRKSIGSLFSKNCIYQNLINPNTFDDTNKFINTFSTKTFLKNANSRKVCSFCTRDEFETEVINAQHMNILFPVYNAFPNAYWNNNEKSVMQICSFCKFIIIHHHLPWIKTNNGDIFINAPSFKIMWYLNKFAKDVVDKNESYNLRKILGISYLELAQKTALTLGAWSLMNVEMVIKKGSDVDYYSLPYNISVILLQKDIASLINSTNEPLILELILEGKIEALLELEYHIQRCLITKNQNQKYVKLIKNKSNMKSLSQVLPILYAKIDKLLKKGGV